MLQKCLAWQPSLATLATLCHTGKTGQGYGRPHVHLQGHSHKGTAGLMYTSRVTLPRLRQASRRSRDPPARPQGQECWGIIDSTPVRGRIGKTTSPGWSRDGQDGQGDQGVLV